MAKATRKKAAKIGGAQPRNARLSQVVPVASGGATASAPTVTRRRGSVAPRTAGLQSLIFPSMVTLGCWGMSISFVFFYNDPNHVLYGGLAALMALLWTYSVFVRVRRMRAARQK